MTTRGWYYDGKSSARHSERIRLEPNGLTILIEGYPLHFSFKQLRISARMSSVVRSIYLDGGGKLEIADNDAVDTWLHGTERKESTLIHRLERNWLLVVHALVGIVVVTWALIVYGTPWLAAGIAEAVPVSVEKAMSDETLAALDDSHLAPTELDASRQAAVRALFDPVARSMPDGYTYTLHFRLGGAMIGANAFALPGGDVIITDEMVELGEDAALTGVFAHECAHVHYRHGLKSLIQGSMVILIISSVTGDISSVSSLTSSLPILLLQNRYSRGFEREADQFATAYMTERGIDPLPLARLFEKLGHHLPDDGIWELFSTHPGTEERVRGLQEANRTNG